jgi:hypothetical protein
MNRVNRFNLVLALALIIVTIISFVIPFPKTASFFISYLFVAIALIAQIWINKIAYKDAQTLMSKFYGFPVTVVGFRYLEAVLISAIVIIICSSANSHFPWWISVVVYLLLTGIAVAGLVTADSTRNYVEQQDVKMQESISFMKRLTVEAQALQLGNNNPEMDTILQTLYEEIRYSDPVSTAELTGYEKQMYVLFTNIQTAVARRDLKTVQLAYDEFHKQLILRNTICKTMKR